MEEKRNKEWYDIEKVGRMNMLNLIMKEMKDFYSYKNKVFLLRTADVEKKFVEVLNLHKDAFWDEKSLELMKNIDTAKRQGDYGVVTDIGESCITCLSTGCKFGLLVLYYQKYLFSISF